MLKVIIVSGAALALSACSAIEGGAFDNFAAAAKVIEKGNAIKKEGAEKLAVGFDGYCSKVPSVARDFVRAEVNKALEERGSKWRASDFCQKVE